MGSQLFARGVNLNWPIRAQSRTCSSRFQTAVDVEHGPRMVVLPYGRILLKFSTTKNGLVIILEVLYDGEFIWLYGNMIFMVIRCSPSWRESILWSWYAENNCEKGANHTDLPLRSKGQGRNEVLRIRDHGPLPAQDRDQRHWDRDHEIFWYHIKKIMIIKFMFPMFCTFILTFAWRSRSRAS